MKRCYIVGIGSDIAQGIKPMLERDGWSVNGAGHGRMVSKPWDLIIFACGTLAPIGYFFSICDYAWRAGVVSNSLAVLANLRAAWPLRGPHPVVIFFGGPNMAKPSPTYTAYRAGKAMLESLVSTLNVEYPECKFAMLHPGVVRTKIHQQTIAAGSRAANFERVQKIVSGEEQTVSMEKVYGKLKELL